jgi:hypothetical protein
MIATTRRWLDSLFELTVLRLVVWFSIAVSTYPGVLKNPFKLAEWFDDHALYAFDEADRITLLRYHQLPAWNPYWCGGKPGIPEPEDSFYSPDSLLRLIFGAEHGRRLAILIFVVAGLEGTYRLCRKLDSTAIASGFGAVVFATQDKFVSFIHDGWVHFMSFELIPWILLALLQGIDSVRWRIIGGIFLAWLVLAPGTYPAPYGAIAFGYWFLAIALYRFFKREKKPFKTPLLSAFTIGGIGVLLSVCKLVPSMAYMLEFPRVFTVVEVHTASEMLGGLVPRHYAIVLLAIIGAVFADLSAGVCIGGALLFFTLSLGDFGPGAPFGILKKLPVLGALRYPERFHVVVVFFTALAASRGLSRLEDAVPGFVTAGWRWIASFPLRDVAKRITGKDVRWLDSASGEVPCEVIWLCVGVAAFLSLKIAAPLAEELLPSQRVASLSLYTEEAPHNYDGEFKQHRGNRRDAHIFPAMNMGSIYCVAGIPIPESGRLRADLPQEEYPADPALAEVRRVSWSPNSIVLDVDAKAPTTIYVNQNWHRKWHSNVGVVRSEDRLLAVDVPAGKMRLELDYRDYGVWISFLISLVTVLAIAWTFGRQLVQGVRREWARVDALPALPSGTPPKVESEKEPVPAAPNVSEAPEEPET